MMMPTTGDVLEDWFIITFGPWQPRRQLPQNSLTTPLKNTPMYLNKPSHKNGVVA